MNSRNYFNLPPGWRTAAPSWGLGAQRGAEWEGRKAVINCSSITHHLHPSILSAYQKLSAHPHLIAHHSPLALARQLIINNMPSSHESRGLIIDYKSRVESHELSLSPRFSAYSSLAGGLARESIKEESDCGGLKNRYKMVIVGYLFSKDNA